MQRSYCSWSSPFNVLSLFHVGSAKFFLRSSSPFQPIPESKEATVQTPSSVLAVHCDLCTKTDFSSPPPLLTNSLIHTPNVGILQSQEKLEESPPISSLIHLQDSPHKPGQEHVDYSEQSREELSLSRNPTPQLPQEDSLDSEQLVESPPTPEHTSINKSYSPVGERGDGESESESEDEDSGGEQSSLTAADQRVAAEGSPQPPLSHERSISTSGSTTPESSILSLEPTSSQATIPSQIDTPSVASVGQDLRAGQLPHENTSVASSSRKVVFSTAGANLPPSDQLGLFSPGSLKLGGVTFHTPPSSSSYQLTSELPPTPFQFANFDLDSSSDNECEAEENSDPLSQRSDSSLDSSYGRRLQEKVEGLISQEEIKSQDNGDILLIGVGNEPQGKLVDVGEPLSRGGFVPLSGRKIVDSADSLRVDDLLGLDSPSLPQLQSPLQAYHSPRVGVLVNIGTPGSNLAARPPLLSSTVQGGQGQAPLLDETKQFLTPNPLPDYMLPSHSGTQSGALLSSCADSGPTWPSLQSKLVTIDFGVCWT